MALTINCINMDLQHLIATNDMETIIVRFTSLLQDGKLGYNINSQHYTMNLNDFNIDQFINKYKLCKFIPTTSTTINTTTTVTSMCTPVSIDTTLSNAPIASNDTTSAFSHEVTISVPTYYLYEQQPQLVQKLLEKGNTNQPIDIDQYPQSSSDTDDNTDDEIDHDINHDGNHYTNHDKIDDTNVTNSQSWATCVVQ